jgi:hypothetical protein
VFLCKAGRRHFSPAGGEGVAERQHKVTEARLRGAGRRPPDCIRSWSASPIRQRHGDCAAREQDRAMRAEVDGLGIPFLAFTNRPVMPQARSEWSL